MRSTLSHDGQPHGRDPGSRSPRREARQARPVSEIWLLAVRAVRARPLRSALTAIAVALGIAVVLAVQIAIQGLTAQAAEAQAQQAGASSLDVRVDAGSGLTTAQITTLGRSSRRRAGGPAPREAGRGRAGRRQPSIGDAVTAGRARELERCAPLGALVVAGTPPPTGQHR